MITGPADHKLHMIYSCLNPIFFVTIMSSSLYRLIITTTSSFSYRLGHKLALAFSGAEVLRNAYELKQFALIVGLQRLLTNQCLFGHDQA